MHHLKMMMIDFLSYHGPGQKIEDKIECCKEFLKIYGYYVIQIPDSV